MLNPSPEMNQEISRRFARVMAALPTKKQEVDDYLAGCDPEHALCLRFLYAFLPLSDVLSFGPDQLDHYVTPALQAREKLSYAETVPTELFLNYVLMPRVNNEYLDLSRELLQKSLWPRMQSKTMAEAALEVNYWCCERVTYHPSDDRTLGPMALMKSTLGRCGEESTFAVSALRSVGIPARQCYVPRWSHCDDNHAWVELWVDGKWHYLGACEPEPVLDKGWFTAAASRAMVVHSRTLSTLVSENTVVQRSDRDTLIHSTEVYAPCVNLRVQVLDQKKPVPGVQVQFQIVNESQCFPIYEQETDEIGQVRFQTGKGSLRLQVWFHGSLLTRLVDTRWENAVTMDLSEGQTPDRLHGTTEVFDMVPPEEQVLPGLPAAQQQRHRQRLAACEDVRAAYTRSFRPDLPGEAKGNWPELAQFLADPHFPIEEKHQLLSTLRPKDFLDCTAEMLADTLNCARIYRDRFDPELYRTYILAPRVANEMLLPLRSQLRQQIPTPFSDGETLLHWLQREIQVIDDAGSPPLVPDCAKAMVHRCIPKSAFGVLFVTLCRTFGIPARRNPHTMAYEWLAEDGFRSIDETVPAQTVPLRLLNSSGQPLPYGHRFTLGIFRGDRYETLRFDGLTLTDAQTLEVPCGNYVLITTTRQIDGTLSTRIHYETIQKASTLSVILPEDQTAQRLRRVPLPLPEGPILDALRDDPDVRMVLFLEPGKEPTEHLLQELLECQEAYGKYRLLLMIPPQADPEQNTLQRVRAVLPHAILRQAEDPAGLQALRQAMGIGDERLPFALALDAQGQGLYACANYNIHTAQTLLNVQQLSLE